MVETQPDTDATPQAHGVSDLCARVDELFRQALREHDRQAPAQPPAGDRVAELAQAWSALPAGEWLAAQERLGVLEQAVLAVLLAVALDPSYLSTLAYLQGDAQGQRPSLPFVLRLLGLRRGALIDALPTLLNGPLFARRLLDCEVADRAPPPGLARGVSLDAQILALFLPRSTLDDSLLPFCRLSRPQAPPPEAIAEETLHAVRQATARQRQALRLHLRGAAGSGKQRIAAALAAERRMDLIGADLAAAAPLLTRQPQLMTRLCREAWLRGAVLYAHGLGGLEERDRMAVGGALVGALQTHPVHCVIGDRLQWPAALRVPGGLARVDVPLPDAPQRARLWRLAAQAGGLRLDAGTALALAVRFRLSAAQIEQAVDDARALRPDDGDSDGTPLSQRECAAAARALSGHALEQLARRVPPRADWSCLVVAPEVEEQLREISLRVQQRPGLAQRLGGDGGAQERLVRERGVTALFSGASGTGKTLAAEVIAADLGLDLFCVDLALVVSKYIGETEKNLDRVFEAAEGANAVLFFDEADALFGKRSEVKDAHDRYANLEIAYLLQKMEQFEGLAILATNLRQNIDDAFTRRVSFSVNFPLPQEPERRRLWRAHWPPQLARGATVDLDALARGMPLAGGNIRNLVLSAAHYATTDASPVEHRHLLRATRREYQKLGKSLTDAECARLGVGGTGAEVAP
ncbi:MAG: ATP-binding protein [Pseudomonadota bacterium]